MYVNCGVESYMKVDDRSYRRSFCSCENEAWKQNYVAMYHSEVLVKKKSDKIRTRTQLISH